MSPAPKGPIRCAVHQTAMAPTARSAVAAARLSNRSAAQNSGGNTAYGSGSTAIIGVDWPAKISTETVSVANAIAASSARRGMGSAGRRSSQVQTTGATIRIPTASPSPATQTSVERSAHTAAPCSQSETALTSDPAAGPAIAPKTRNASTSRRCASERSKRATRTSSHQPRRSSAVASAAAPSAAAGGSPTEKPTATAPATSPGATLGPQATSAASAMPADGHMAAMPPSRGKSANAAMPAIQ